MKHKYSTFGKTSDTTRVNGAYVVRGRGVGHLDVSSASQSAEFREATTRTLDKIDKAFPKGLTVKTT